MLYDFDFIVIGSGAGGSTFAGACAQAGKSVLLLERGNRYTMREQRHDEHAMLFAREPYDDRRVWVNKELRRLYIGGVLGGSTALYGAALMRPAREDFHPGKYYSAHLPRAIWDWPISYDDLEAFYTEAEQLYRVAGCGEDDFGPLEKPLGGFPRAAATVQPINRQLMAANRTRGLRPFRLPLAIDFQQCLHCDVCPGYICPTGARRSSAHVIDQTIAEGYPLQLMEGTEVEGFCRDGKSQVVGVRVHHRASGGRAVYTAKRYALAAGAIGSPTLLLQSGIEGPLIGRNYMFHLCPITAGVFPQDTGADTAFIKQVGFADYYLGTKRFPHKLGLIQSLPAPGPRMLARSAPVRLPQQVLHGLRKKMLPLAGIVEDLPNPSNRVCLGKNGAAQIVHRFGPYDVERGKRLGKFMRQILRRAGAWFCLSRNFPSEEHVAHQCGSLRFGRNAADAVLDPDCRMFGQPNLFVVDGSFFPTSLGVGPALTIMANALRVARVVTKEL
jgi:choline dehydrogenase-like flavoprotein